MALALAFVLCAAAVVGCGGSGHAAPPTTGAATPKMPVARQVCQRALSSARPLLGAHTTMRITGSDPTGIECRVSGGGMQLDVNAQASPRAWAQFDTVVVHQAQGFGTTNGENPALPIDIPGPNSAAWIPVRGQFVTTNGTQSKGGSYVTVSVTRRSRRGPSSLKVARTVGEATLAVAPRGASPGPPPS